MTKKREAEKVYEEEESRGLREWAESTTCHGIRDLVRAQSNAAKFTWFFLILACIAFMTYQVYVTLDEFSKHKWTSSIVEEVRESVRLPSVTFCNYNRILKSKAEEYEMPEDAMRYLYGMVLQGGYVMPDPVQELMKGSDTARRRDIYTAWRLKHNFTFNEIFDALGYACDDMFLDGKCYRQKNGTDTVQPIFTAEFQRCMNYDPQRDPNPERASAEQPGVFDALAFVLNVQKYDYVDLVYNNYPDEGIVVQISYDNKVEIGEWIALPPGTHVRVAIKKREDRIKNTARSFLNPFSFFDSMPPCDAEQTLRYTNETYTRSSCIYECWFTQAVQSCNCVPYLQSNQYRTCEAEEMIECLGLTSLDAIVEVRAKCKVGCHAPCDADSIETQLSYSKFPAQSQVKGLAEIVYLGNDTESKLTDNLVWLDVFFDSLTVKVVERYPIMTTEMFISNAGGLLSLWAGMSFITIFQFIAFMVDRMKPSPRHVATPVQPVSTYDRRRSASARMDGRPSSKGRMDARMDTRPSSKGFGPPPVEENISEQPNVMRSIS